MKENNVLRFEILIPESRPYPEDWPSERLNDLINQETIVSQKFFGTVDKNGDLDRHECTIKDLDNSRLGEFLLQFMEICRDEQVFARLSFHPDKEDKHEISGYLDIGPSNQRPFIPDPDRLPENPE
jgi:hypothetical protein